MAANTTGQAGNSQSKEREWFLDSHFPVLFPNHKAFTLSDADFGEWLRRDLTQPRSTAIEVLSNAVGYAETETATLISTPPSTTADLRDALGDFEVESVFSGLTQVDSGPEIPSGNTLIDGLVRNEHEVLDMTNKMLTENGDVTFRSSLDPLVDLFSDLEEVLSGPRLNELLQNAWNADRLATLKIIFNSRSIHLGKSSRHNLYRCFGWLAKYHPLTLINNLPWVCRPVIEKIAKRHESDPDVVMVEAEKDETDPARFDVKYGVAHGYWKDLLNILALSASKKLDVLAEPRDVLNVEKPKVNRGGTVKRTPDEVKSKRRHVRDHRHAEAVEAFETDSFHRALHIQVTRLFAEQLKADLVRLRSGDKAARRHISLCAKWAPSQKLFHDKHTFIVSSISEVLHPQSEFPTVTSRDEYLRRAREAYRKDVSAIRRYLEVVERDVTAQTFDQIKYDRVPSVAMNNYAGMFATKDTERFEKYIQQVADGQKKISGAVLLPSTLIKAARTGQGATNRTTSLGKRSHKGAAKAMLQERLSVIDHKVIDGQWKSLVNRIKKSGSLESSIAVCDVSGSMLSPQFADGTCPMDSAIGLSLLLAEVTKPPFGGHFITFSDQPTFERVNPQQDLGTKVQKMSRARWAMNTNFAAVFEKLILRTAVKNKVPKEDMVKQIFVFSDMQFDNAKPRGEDPWSNSLERIRYKYQEAGYEIPKLIFWNLAGGRGGYTGLGDATAPKPVTSDEAGTALVSGYSQGLLKVFLDNGSFEEPEEPVEEIVEKEGEDGEVEVKVNKKQKMDPLTTVKKAIGHKAYAMLEVFD